MNDPLFSIITIALNDLDGFVETKASIESQTFADFQWILVDGGSTDGTLGHLQQLDRPNCKWISQVDEGIYDAMNKGLEMSTGQYVIFMNAGDRFCDPNVLSHVDILLKRNEEQVGFIFGDAYEQDAKGQLLLKPARSLHGIRRGMFTHHQAMFYSRKAIGDMRYDKRFRIAGDYQFTCRLLSQAICSVRAGFPISINKRGGVSENSARIGRRENLIIQKEILKIGPAQRAYNLASFLISAVMRSHMRGLYDRLRFRHDGSV
jgi:putative colanic acid biosynthesis glycosyltransferase